jgi:hypothetical protein
MLHYYSVNEERFLASRKKYTWLACWSAMLLEKIVCAMIRQYLGSRGTPQLGGRQQAKGINKRLS